MKIKSLIFGLLMFKRYLLIVALICALSSLLHTQSIHIDTTPSSDRITLYHTLALFDPSQATSGYFIERSQMFGNIKKFSGDSLTSYNKVSLTKYGLAFARLAAAAIDPLYALPISSVALGTPSQSGDTIPFKMMFFDYHGFRADAVTNGDVQIVNNQIQNVAGRNPLEQRSLLMAIPWLTGQVKSSTTVFQIEPLLTNRTDIKQIEADFADGLGWRTILTGQWISIKYTNNDTLTILTRVLLRSGQYLHTHCDLIIDIPVASERDYGIGFDIPIAGATVTGLSSCGDQTICKPLIFVEGFNAPLIGNDNFNTFRNRFNGNNLPTPTSNSVLDEFETAGHDIIYIDFDDGTASLEDNAEVVKSVIRRVNELKAEAGCGQPNVVWGESMGGVLAKLALHEMEFSGEEHDCYKLITFDSPLRGANVPLGFQHMLDHIANTEVNISGTNAKLKDFVPMLQDAENTLLSGAAQDMLIYHYAHFPQISPSFTALYQKLINFGSLQNCEHIAISNGSQIGTNQGFLANARLINIEGEIDDILENCADVNGILSDIIDFFADVFLNTEVDVNFSV